MDLHTYISDMARRATLASDAGTSTDYLWQVATGRRRASHLLAAAIERATHGAVSRTDLRPDIWPVSTDAQQREAA